MGSDFHVLNHDKKIAFELSGTSDWLYFDFGFLKENIDNPEYTLMQMQDLYPPEECAEKNGWTHEYLMFIANSIVNWIGDTPTKSLEVVHESASCYTITGSRYINKKAEQ